MNFSVPQIVSGSKKEPNPTKTWNTVPASVFALVSRKRAHSSMAMKETAGTGAISLFDYYNGGDGDLFANGSDSDDGLMKEGGLICLSATYVDLNTREEYHARQRLLWGGHVYRLRRDLHRTAFRSPGSSTSGRPLSRWRYVLSESRCCPYFGGSSAALHVALLQGSPDWTSEMWLTSVRLRSIAAYTKGFRQFLNAGISILSFLPV
ncbi:hypothetical protein GN244_ATG11133 [Phytophthora infestans]|uniref:Uncharacterized protein n=1 Tax=Phytophthora infestans TaxID=4787 RepID=A0A833S8K9_PHYIN|nr:hypothetical protein GN244_ATG11133 [Phytophthora infestans]